MNNRITNWMAFVFMVTSINAFSQNCSFIISEAYVGPTCPGGQDGWIDLTIEGDSPIYLFDWQTYLGSGLEQQSEDQSQLSAGIYYATIIDTSGCEVQIVVELPDGIDETPPTLICPVNKVVNLGPGECSKVFTFIVTAFDDCHASPIIHQTDTTGYHSGDFFPIGNTILSFEANDGSLTSSCSFSIKINEYDPPGNLSLSCAGPLNVALDKDCSANLSADVLLNGSQHGCYDDYEVSFINAGGITIYEEDFPNWINKTIYGKVHDPETNTFCFSTIHLFDFLKPIIHCIDTLEVSCGESLAQTQPSVLGYPPVSDNCTTAELNFFDQYNDLSCSSPLFGGQYSAWIKRTWTAEDAYGNKAIPCIQHIFFKRKNINDVVFPLSLTDQFNTLPSLDCDNANVSPNFTGVPMVDGRPIYPNNTGQCEFQVTYADNIVTACGGGRNILRTWTVNDACENEIKTHLQVIQIKDKLPPVITCQSFYSLSTNTGECKAVLFIPPAQVSDNCSSFNVYISYSSGVLNGNLLFNIPIGLHQITYRAVDECGNESTCQMLLSVYDGYLPVADCDPSKSVSLTTTGQTSLPASVFNDNSYDDCGGGLQFSVRRPSDLCGLNGTSWANTVKFCCEDVGKSIPVELRVTDYSGNHSICNSVVHVSDLIPPAITCPSSFTMECSVDIADLSVFGKVVQAPNQQSAILVNGVAKGVDGFATDNCSILVEELMAERNVNSCQVGKVIRHFKATDSASKSATCSQQITLVNSDPFYINPNNAADPNDDVEYPPNITISDCTGNAEPALTGSPVILGNGCGQIGVTHSDQIISQTATGYVIRRKWTIADFCQLGGGQGIWNYFQNITVKNSDVVPPQIEGFDEIVSVCTGDVDCEQGSVSFSLQAIDDCSPANKLIWEYGIDLQNDGSMDLTGNSNAIHGTLPLGIHKTSWKVTDEAGNYSTGVQFLLIEDCLPPVPICHDTFYVTLDVNGTLHLPAEYMQAGYSSDNCSAYGDLMFFVSPFLPNYISDHPPLGALSEMDFGCPAMTHHLELWVGDEMDNWSRCQFYLDVADFFEQCDEVVLAPISIDGHIRTETGAVVGQTSIQVNAGSPAISDNNGYYAFYGLAAGGDFSIIPRKDVAPLNGVTTYDLVLIRRHILAIQMLDSPYKIIAADANKSNSVTTSDLVTLQKLILHVDADFTNNESWRFVDANFVFPNPLNPFQTPFPEVKSFNNLFNSKKVDFIGIKTGDVNGSANPAGIWEGEGDDQ